MNNKFKIGMEVQGVSFWEDGTYDELGEGKIIKVHKCPSGLYSYTIECEPDNFHMVFYEDELKEIGNE
jgi:hypothetical protein